MPQNLPKSFKKYNSVPKPPVASLGTIKNLGKAAFCVSPPLAAANVRQVKGNDRALGKSKHFWKHVGDTSWPFVQQSHPEDQDMSILHRASLSLICAAAWKTHTQEMWLRIFRGKESCSRPLGASYAGDQPERNRFCFFHAHRFTARLSQMQYQSSEAQAVTPDSTLAARSGLPGSGWAWKLPSFIGQLCQTTLADPPGHLQALCNSITHCAAMRFSILVFASKLPLASGHVSFLEEL